MRPQHFTKSAAKRQAVLDILNEHDGLSPTAITAHLGWSDRAEIYWYLRKMAELCEVYRYSKSPPIWKARVRITRDAQDMSASSGRAAKPTASSNPWHIVHLMADTPKKSYSGQTSKSRPRGCTILEAV